MLIFQSVFNSTEGCNKNSRWILIRCRCRCGCCCCCCCGGAFLDISLYLKLETTRFLQVPPPPNSSFNDVGSPSLGVLQFRTIRLGQRNDHSILISIIIKFWWSFLAWVYHNNTPIDSIWKLGNYQHDRNWNMYPQEMDLFWFSNWDNLQYNTSFQSILWQKISSVRWSKRANSTSPKLHNFAVLGAPHSHSELTLEPASSSGCGDSSMLASSAVSAAASVSWPGVESCFSVFLGETGHWKLMKHTKKKWLNNQYYINNIKSRIPELSTLPCSVPLTLARAASDQFARIITGRRGLTGNRSKNRRPSRHQSAGFGKLRSNVVLTGSDSRIDGTRRPVVQAVFNRRTETFPIGSASCYLLDPGCQRIGPWRCLQSTKPRGTSDWKDKDTHIKPNTSTISTNHRFRTARLKSNLSNIFLVYRIWYRISIGNSWCLCSESPLLPFAGPTERDAPRCRGEPLWVGFTAQLRGRCKACTWDERQSNWLWPNSSRFWDLGWLF